MVVKRSINIVFVGKSVSGAHLRIRSNNPFNAEILEEEEPMSLSVREFATILDVG